jgi:hypothetical protein
MNTPTNGSTFTALVTQEVTVTRVPLEALLARPLRLPGIRG